MKKCPWCEKNPAGNNIDGFCSIKCEKEFKAWCDAEAAAAKMTKTHTKDLSKWLRQKRSAKKEVKGDELKPAEENGYDTLVEYYLRPKK